MKLNFWESKLLSEMTKEEWESLCDGCGQCCLIKLEDEETHELYVTNISCHLLDIEACHCCDYKHRLQKVSKCLLLTPDKLEEFKWLPETCAYRKISEGKKLEHWHPLVSKNNNSIHEAGISVRDFAQSEEYIHPDQIHDHVIKKL